MSTPAPKENPEAVTLLRLPPDEVRRAGGWLAEAAKRSLSNDAGLRVIALLLAVGLWFFVNTGQRGSVESYNVPVSYRNLPQGMVITKPRLPQTVKVEVSGPRTLLSLIDPSRLVLKLDLTGVTPGATTLRINPEVFNVPRQTEVVGVVPPSITLEVDEIVTRNVPVHVMLTGTPATGYRVAATEVNPLVAAVRGPGRELAHLGEIASVAIDTTGAAVNLARRVPLIAPAWSVSIDPDTVTANVVIAPVVVEKEFRGIPIQAHGIDLPYRMEPGHVNVTVRVPELVLDRFDPHEIATIDGDGMMPGSYDVPVQITLPGGSEVVHQSVAKVKLRIYRERRSSRH